MALTEKYNYLPIASLAGGRPTFRKVALYLISLFEKIEFCGMVLWFGATAFFYKAMTCQQKIENGELFNI